MRQIIYTPCTCGSDLYRFDADVERFECVSCKQGYFCIEEMEN